MTMPCTPTASLTRNQRADILRILQQVEQQNQRFFAAVGGMRKDVFQIAIRVGTNPQHQALVIALVRQIIKNPPLDALHRHVEFFRHAHGITDRAAFFGALMNHQCVQPAPARAHRFDHRPMSVQEFRHNCGSVSPTPNPSPPGLCLRDPKKRESHLSYRRAKVSAPLPSLWDARHRDGG